MTLYIPIIIIAAFFLYIIFPWCVKYCIKRRFNFEVQKSSSVWITFDDGPHPVATPKILNILHKYNVKATFFLLGKNAYKYPLIVRSIIRAGHGIGIHSYKHTHPWKTDPLTSFIDIHKGSKAVKNYLSDCRGVYFRPPFGKFNLATLLYTLLKKYRICFWTIDPEDYKNRPVESTYKGIIDKIKPGCVILLHDGRIRESSYVSHTISILELILKYCVEQGITVQTITC